jgi:nitrate/nitrite transport system permease protein
MRVYDGKFQQPPKTPLSEQLETSALAMFLFNQRGKSCDATTEPPVSLPAFKTDPVVAFAAPKPAASIIKLDLPKGSDSAAQYAKHLARWGKAILTYGLPPLIVVLLLLVVWETLASSPTSSLPSPVKVWQEAGDLIIQPFYVNGDTDLGLGWRVLYSLQKVATGFGLAALVGIMLGVLVGQSVWATRGLDPLFQILRTVPPLAWLPISLAAFRDSVPSAIFVIFITAIWPIIINTAVGIRNIPQDYRNVSAVIRLNPVEFFLRIMLPAAAPYIFTGLRIGVGLAWLAIVAAEMLTGGKGIGIFIWDAWNSSHLSDIVVALLYIGLVGFILDRIVAFAGRLVTRGVASA